MGHTFFVSNVIHKEQYISDFLIRTFISFLTYTDFARNFLNIIYTINATFDRRQSCTLVMAS